MASAYAAASRYVIRSAARRPTCSRFSSSSAAAKPKTRPSPIRSLKQDPLRSRCNFRRSPVEISSFLYSMLPYHTATASALLTSMLSVKPCGYGWTPEDCNDDV